MAKAAEQIAAGRRARADGNLEEARARYREAAEILRGENDQLAYAHTIRHVADMYLHERAYAAALALYEEALGIYRGNLDTKLLDLANTVRPYALLNEAIGNQNEAGQLWREAKSLYSSLRLEAGVRECDMHLELAVKM